MQSQNTSHTLALEREGVLFVFYYYEKCVLFLVKALAKCVGRWYNIGNCEF